LDNQLHEIQIDALRVCNGQLLLMDQSLKQGWLHINILPSAFNLDAKGENQERGLSIQIGGAQAKIPTIAVAHGSIPNESSIVRDWKLIKGS
jgi:hypothetical protein